MIFAQLNNLRIPYIVFRVKEVSLVTGEVGRYHYEIFLDYDVRLKRLGFNTEREILKKQRAYMYRELSDREVRIFRTYNYAPTVKDENITIWEFNGKIKKYPQEQERDEYGRFMRKP